MLIALFPNLHKLTTIYLFIPISTASSELSFSDMKLIKNLLRNCITESPEKFTECDLEEIVDVRNRKGRQIVV